MNNPKRIEDVLINPPMKEIKCRRCGGKGYINPRGMISSDDCPKCLSYKHTEKIVDIKKQKQQILDIILSELPEKKLVMDINADINHINEFVRHKERVTGFNECHDETTKLLTEMKS